MHGSQDGPAIRIRHPATDRRRPIERDTHVLDARAGLDTKRHARLIMRECAVASRQVSVGRGEEDETARWHAREGELSSLAGASRHLHGR